MNPPRIRIPFSAVYLIYAFCFGKWLLHFFISFAIKRVLTNYNVIFLLCWGPADLRNQTACYFYDMLSFYHLCFDKMYSTSPGRTDQSVTSFLCGFPAQFDGQKVIIPFFLCANEFEKKNTKKADKREGAAMKRKIVIQWCDKGSLLHYTTHRIWLGQMIFTVAKKKRKVCICNTLNLDMTDSFCYSLWLIQ